MSDRGRALVALGRTTLGLVSRESMDYRQLLGARRALWAAVIRRAFSAMPGAWRPGDAA